MKWFTNARIMYKLSILIVLAVTSLMIVGLSGYEALISANKSSTSLYENHLLAIEQIKDSESQARHLQVDIVELMLAKDDSRIAAIKNDIDLRRKQFADDLSAYEKMNLDAYQTETLGKLHEEVRIYGEYRDMLVKLSLDKNKNPDELYALYAKSVVGHMDAFQKCTEELSAYSIKQAQENNHSNQENFIASRNLVWGILIFSTLLFIACAWFIAKSITLPLQAMANLCREFAAGDFSRQQEPVSRRDEIGVLSLALGTMRTQLHSVLKKVHTSSQQVAASSEELTASAEHTAQAIMHTAESVSDIAIHADTQLKTLDHSQQVTEAMNLRLQQAAANSQQVTNRSAQAARMAQNGSSYIHRVIDQMQKIESNVLHSAKVVGKLGSRSKEVGQIVDTISSISGQTNLLALNAAVEAARAGEQGRGFSVVAEEVRKLAEQSQEAAKQITSLIRDIQEDTELAVSAMHDGTQEVQRGSEAVSAAGTVFKEIVGLIEEVSVEVTGISSAVEDLAEGSKKIVSSIDIIDKESRLTAEQTQTIAASSEEQSAAMEEISSASHHLAVLAQDLQGAIEHFKIS